jgi:uncharacterized protein YecA (UPF0149 family)
MGAIADAMMAYIQPMLEQSDGSPERMQRALMLGQLCWNMALLPNDERENFLEHMRPSLNLNDKEFDDFRNLVIAPMMRRYEQMFPGKHGIQSRNMPGFIPTQQIKEKPQLTVKKYHGTGRNAPCPCNSGRKYKLCCGR